MFREGTISKLTVPVLDLFLYKLNLASGKQKKAEKVNKSNAWLANSEYHKIQQSGIRDERDNEKTGEDSDSDSDISDDEGDVILQDVGESNDDYESDSENDKILLHCKYRTLRQCTTYLTCHFYGDSY